MSIEDEGYSNVTRIVQSCENAFIVLPSSYRHNERFLNAVCPRQGKKIQATVSPSSQAPPEGVEQSTSINASLRRGTASQRSQASGRAQDSERSDQQQVESSIFYLANVEFNINKAKNMCALVSVGGMPTELIPDKRIAYLSHIFGNDTSFIRVVGGLLAFIVKNGVLSCMTRNDNMIDIHSISYRNYCGVMKISPVTLRALNVFSDDIHPVGRGGMRSKEGLSLYGLLQSRVKTGSARLLLRLWLIYPSTDLSVIKERQFLVGTFLDGSNRALTVGLRYALVSLKNVRNLIGRMRRVVAGLADWKGLYGCAKAFITVLEALKMGVQQSERLKNCALVAKILSVREPDLREVVSWIDAVVDFDESAITGRLIVASGFSEEIDDLKRSYNAMDDFLTKVSIQELKELVTKEGCPSVTSLQVVYVPQVGFLAVLREEDVDGVGVETWEKHGLRFVFHSKESGYHFRNERCRVLDEEIGDIHGAILDLESKAYQYLEKQVLMYCESLCVMGDAVCELDCLQGLAACAQEMSWTLPTMVDDSEGGEVRIEEGRHVLLESKVASFVSNSTHLRIGDVHVVTGPNYSGKSVYMSQIVLMVILAQIGSGVPAKSATMLVMHRINSRVNSFESVSDGQSSFFGDASQVSAMLSKEVQECKRSFNVIDEFGKGTSEVDGAALLTATLNELWQTAVKCESITICATHFTDILKEQFVPMCDARFAVFSMQAIIEMDGQPEGHGQINDTIVNDGSRNDKEVDDERHVNINDVIVRTYRVLKGVVCTESRALQCALDVGVDRMMLSRAAHVEMAVCGGHIEAAVGRLYDNARMALMRQQVNEFCKSEFAFEE